MLEKNYKETWAERLKRLGDFAYSDYLKSDEWLGIRRKAASRKHYKTCWLCGTTKCLELHHRTYKWIGTRNTMRGLVAVCRSCHQKIHKYARENRISVRLATNRLKKKAGKPADGAASIAGNAKPSLVGRSERGLG